LPYFGGMVSVTITAKNQVTLKKALLEAIGARPGDKLDVDIRRGSELVMSLRRPRTRTWDDLAGILERPGQRPVSIEEMNEAIAQAGADAGMSGLEKP
jgi:hypothetical protein